MILEGIDKIIDETKKRGLKPKYLVCNYITKSYIPFKVNSKGEELYKGLKIQTYAFAPIDTIYLHRYKPKL